KHHGEGSGSIWQTDNVSITNMVLQGVMHAMRERHHRAGETGLGRPNVSDRRSALKDAHEIADWSHRLVRRVRPSSLRMYGSRLFARGDHRSPRAFLAIAALPHPSNTPTMCCHYASFLSPESSGAFPAR